MATIRAWLNGAGFDWKKGTIVFQPVGDGVPGWGDPVSGCWLKPAKIINDDPVLDHHFYDGYGGPQCPRFVARDTEAVYFPSQYDGATSIEKVFLDLSRYVGEKEGEFEESPYPGG